MHTWAKGPSAFGGSPQTATRATTSATCARIARSTPGRSVVTPKRSAHRWTTWCSRSAFAPRSCSASAAAPANQLTGSRTKRQASTSRPCVADASAVAIAAQGRLYRTSSQCFCETGPGGARRPSARATSRLHRAPAGVAARRASAAQAAARHS